MNIIFSREFNYGDNKEFKSFVEEIINSKEMEEYKNLELSTDTEDNETVNDFYKNNIGSMFTINNITSFSFEICNLNLTDKETEALKSFQYNFYPFSTMRITLRIKSLYNKITDEIAKGEFKVADYNIDAESMELINVVSEKLKELLTIKLHEKGIVYYSKLEEKKLEPKDILEIYHQEILYRYTEYLNPENTINSKEQRFDITLPYNHCDTMIQDKYGYFNAVLYSSKNIACIYVNRFEDDGYDEYDYGDKSYTEVCTGDRTLLNAHSNKIDKVVNDYIKVLNTEVKIENKIDN